MFCDWPTYCVEPSGSAIRVDAVVEVGRSASQEKLRQQPRVERIIAIARGVARRAEA